MPYDTKDMKKAGGSSEDQKKRISEIMRRFDEAKRQKVHLVPKWHELDKFYRGEQYDGMNLPAWIPKPVTNFIHLVVTTKRAALAVENPSAVLRAVSPEEIDPVNDMQEVFEWVWDRVNAKHVVRENIETSELLGTGIAHVYWDENTGVMGGKGAYYEGEIRVCEIDPSGFFPDPTAYRMKDCQYIHVVEKKPRTWIEEMFKIKLVSQSNDMQNNDVLEPYERVREYNALTGDDLVEVHAHYEKYWNEEPAMEDIPQYATVPNINPSTGQANEAMAMPDASAGEMGPSQIVDEAGNPEPEMEEVQVGWEKRPRVNEYGEQEIVGGWRYKVTYICQGQILGTINPLEPNMYPFAVLYGYAQRQSFWGKSTAELILENQKLINKVEGITAMIGVLLQNPQKIVNRKAGIPRSEIQRYGNAPGHAWYVNGDVHQAMKWMDPPTIPPALIQLAEAAKGNIREVTGLNEAYTGESVGSLQTSSGVDSLIDRATLRDRDRMLDIEQYMEDLCRLLLGFITTKYTEERYLRVINDPTDPDKTTFRQFLGTDYKDIEYDVEIDISSRAPISIMRRAAEAKQLMEMQGQYNYPVPIIEPEEFIQHSDFVNARAIIKRMKSQRLMNDMQRLTQTLDVMYDAMMQEMDPEQVHQVGMQYLQQLMSGQVDPNAPGQAGNEPGGDLAMMGQQAIGNTDNTGQVQMQQEGV